MGNFKDNETSRISLRPLIGQNLPTNLVIECRKGEMESPYSFRTKFITDNVKVCLKSDSRI
jgi:hypothetical protein